MAQLAAKSFRELAENLDKRTAVLLSATAAS